MIQVIEIYESSDSLNWGWIADSRRETFRSEINRFIHSVLNNTNVHNTGTSLLGQLCLYVKVVIMLLDKIHNLLAEWRACQRQAFYSAHPLY